MTDYDQKYHDLSQVGERPSTLKERPELKFDKMVDRDRTSHMKEQFMYLNNVKKEQEQKRIELNH